MKQWISSSRLEESLLNDRDKTPLDYVPDLHGTPVLDFTGKSFAREEDASRTDLGDPNPNQEKSMRTKRQFGGD